MPRRFLKTWAGPAGMRAMRRLPSVTSGDSSSPIECIRCTRRSIRARLSSQITSSFPNACAIAAKVRSSGVGPRPPLTKTSVISASSSSRRIWSTISSGLSRICVTRFTGKPSSRSRSAIQWELVSRVKPPTSSSPMATMLDAGMADHINMERLHAVIRGDVQGVGFRYFVLRKAQQLGLRGWVRNNDDGTVELVAEGARQDLEQLKRAVGEGPRMARVDRVDTRWQSATGNLDGFDLAG